VEEKGALPGAIEAGEAGSKSALREKVFYGVLSLCLSRACLGKMFVFVFIYKWLKKPFSLTSCGNYSAQNLPPAPPTRTRNHRQESACRTAHSCENTHISFLSAAFPQLFLCLSRACLGKKMTIILTSINQLQWPKRDVRCFSHPSLSTTSKWVVEP
jgi:hypothetical protein